MTQLLKTPTLKSAQLMGQRRDWTVSVCEAPHRNSQLVCPETDIYMSVGKLKCFANSIKQNSPDVEKSVKPVIPKQVLKPF